MGSGWHCSAPWVLVRVRVRVRVRVMVRVRVRVRVRARPLLLTQGARVPLVQRT